MRWVAAFLLAVGLVLVPSPAHAANRTECKSFGTDSGDGRVCLTVNYVDYGRRVVTYYRKWTVTAPYDTYLNLHNVRHRVSDPDDTLRSWSGRSWTTRTHYDYKNVADTGRMRVWTRFVVGVKWWPDTGVTISTTIG